MKKKIIFITILISFIIFVYIQTLNKDIYPSECTEKFYIDKIDYEYKLEKLETKLQRNLANKDLKFVCFLGLTYHFPGLSLETDEKMIKKYGSKLICTGDITDEKHSIFIQKLYNYYANYNQILLEKLHNRD